MALVLTPSTALSRTGSSGTVNYTSGNTTVPANSTVVFLVYGCSWATSTPQGSMFTLTTSAAGTATAIGNTPNSTVWGFGVRAFYVVNSTGSDITTTVTVNLSSGTDAMGTWWIKPLVFTGIAASSQFTGFVAAQSAGATAKNMTLTAAPAAGDITILGWISVQNSNADFTATVNSDFTSIEHYTDSATEDSGQYYQRTGSTSTTVGFTTTSNFSGVAADDVLMYAFNVKASTGGSAPTLTSPASSSIQTTTATVGATTDTASGTIYSVIYTGSQPTVTQIKAGQNSAGSATPNANATVSSAGAKTLNVTGLTANTAYNYAVVHNNTVGDSNIVTGTLTTLAVPVLSAATTASITTTGATLGATTTVGAGTLYVVAYTGSVPTATQIKAGQDSTGTATPNANVAVSSTGAKTIAVTGMKSGTAYNFALVQNDGSDSNVLTSTVTTSTIALTTPASSSIAATSASVGATTDTGAGTMYVVVYTGTAPTATQIKAGQNSSGTATPNASAAVSSTGAKLLSITGLTASTTYNYSVLQNNGGDSNIVTGTFTTSAPTAPVLTSPTSSSIAGTTATVGATTDTGSGTLYAVAYSSGTTPTATQIKAGQNSSGATVPSGTVTVTATGAKTINLTGLSTGTAYTYALVQNNGSDSNVVTGTFTTLSPAVLTSPISSSVTGTTASVGATSDKTGTMYAVVSTTNTAPSTTQIKAGQNAAGATVPSASGAAAASANLLSITGLSTSTTYYYFVVVNNAAGDSNIATGSFTTSSVSTPSLTLKQYWLKNWQTGTPATLQSPYNTTPAAIGAGSTVIAITAGWDATRQVPVPGDTAGTFAILTDGTTSAVSNPDSISVHISGYANATGGNHTFSVPTINDGTGGQNGELGVWIFEITNMPATLTVRNVAVLHAINTTKPWSLSTSSAPQVGDLVLAMSTLENSAATVNSGLTDPPSGFTSLPAANQDGTNFIPTANSYKIVTSAGVQTAQWTCTDPNKSEHFAILVTLAPATSGGGAPTLSSPTSSNVLTTTATVGATTDTNAGTMYAVVYTGATPTATQIKAGQNASGVTVPSGNLVVSSTGAKTINITGLTANTAYNYALVHNNSSDSNVVTGTLTTLAVPVLSSPTSSSVLTTTATVGATTTVGAGTLYAVAYTGSQPSATQIKAGQNSAGSATPNASVSVSSTGAKTINLTGLSSGTAYNYALVQNDGSDSNVVTGTFTTQVPTATLSSPTSSSVAATTATIGATTDTGSGTLYGVVYTGSTPTATQIKAGQNSAGIATPSNSAAVASSGAKTLAITGLTQLTSYNYALVQNVAAGDSNVVSGSFTTTATPVTITSTSSSNPAVGSTLTINGSGFGASQGTGTVTIGGANQTVTSWSDTLIAVTVSAGTNLYGVSVNLVVTNGSGTISSNYSLASGFAPQSGWAYTNIGTPNATAANRLTSTGDIASGDQVAYDTKGSTVTVFTDATFSSTIAQTFSFMVGVTGIGYGSSALQTISAVGGLISNFHGILSGSIATIHGVNLTAIATKHGVTR